MLTKSKWGDLEYTGVLRVNCEREGRPCVVHDLPGSCDACRLHKESFGRLNSFMEIEFLGLPPRPLRDDRPKMTRQRSRGNIRHKAKWGETPRR